MYFLKHISKLSFLYINNANLTEIRNDTVDAPKKLELKTCNNAFYMFSLSELTTLRSTAKILNRKSSLVLTEFKNDGSFRICGLGRFYQSETDVRYENKHENRRNAKLKNYYYATLA